MKKYLATILMLCVALSLSACKEFKEGFEEGYNATPKPSPTADATAPSPNPTAGEEPTIPTSESTDDLLTEDEARKLLQTWLDDNPLNPPAYINDALTTDKETGFHFVLFQNDEEVVTIRVVKSNGTLLRYNQELDTYNPIDSWYANRPDTTTASIADNVNPSTTQTTPDTQRGSMTREEARTLLQTWIDEHPLIDPVIINDELTREGETAFNFVLYQKEEELVRVRVIKETGMLALNIANQTVLLDGWYETRTDKPTTLSDNDGTEDDKILYSQISYEDLVRFPDENYGAGVILYGQVYHVRSNPLLQAINPDRNIIVLATREDNGLWCYDLIDVRFDFTPQGGRIIEGDWITVYGTASGLTSASNAPLVDAVEIIRD